MVRCIDCASLDYGFALTDSFPHCSIRHSRAILDAIKKCSLVPIQHEIKIDEAYIERNCNDFKHEEREDPEHIYHLTKEEIEDGRKFAVKLQKEVVRKARPSRVKIQLIKSGR